MTNTEIVARTAQLFDSGSITLSEEQADFLAFLLRTVANGRDIETIQRRAAQFGRAMGVVEANDAPVYSVSAEDIHLANGTLSAHAGAGLVHQVKALRRAFFADLTDSPVMRSRGEQRLASVARAWGLPVRDNQGSLRTAKSLADFWNSSRVLS